MEEVEVPKNDPWAKAPAKKDSQTGSKIEQKIRIYQGRCDEGGIKTKIGKRTRIKQKYNLDSAEWKRKLRGTYVLTSPYHPTGDGNVVSS